LLKRALKAAHDKGIVLIAAAGSAGPKSPPLYPGADSNVIAVTATDVNDKVFSGANRGPRGGGAQLRHIGAGARQHLSADHRDVGLVALLLERNPNLTPDEVRKVLISSVRRVGTKERDDDYGSGLIDPSKADRHLGRLDASPLEYPALKLGERQITLSGGEIQKPCRMRLQRRAAFAATRPGSDAARLALKLHPAHRRRWAHFEPLRRLPPR
jgi:hypothetical protein